MLIKKALPHCIAFVIFLGLSMTYFYPQVQGLTPEQKDIVDYEAMEGEVNEFERKTGEKVYWNNGMFGGMPWGMMIYGRDNNMLSYLVDPLQLWFYRPLGIFFKSMVICYICLLFLGVNPWLSIVGSVAFTFNTNHFVLMEIGHISKLNVLVNLPLLLTGMLLVFQKKWWWGGLLFALGTSFVIYHNHPQMIYYFVIFLTIIGIAKMIPLMKKAGYWPSAKIIGILMIAGLLGLATNLSQLIATQIFTEDTIRGKNIVKGQQAQQTSNDEAGLKFSYAMEFSNGVLDLGSMMIPALVGGSTSEETSADTKVGRLMRLNNANRKPSGLYETHYYWGSLPFTTGPYYLSAAVFLIFLFGIFYFDYYTRVGVLTSVVLACMISMGDNLAWFNKLLFEYLPYFDKFRAPNSVMNVLPPLFVIIGFSGLQKAFSKQGKKERQKAISLLKKTAYPLLGICLFFALFGPSLFSFTVPSDEAVSNVLDAFIADRKALMRTESFRSLFIILITGVAMGLYLANRIKAMLLLAGILLATITVDLWLVGQRYFDRDDFVKWAQYQKNFEPRPADKQIFKAEKRGRGFYRVVDYSVNTYQSSYTTIFHNSIGGYYAAKLQRMQDIIDYHIMKGNREVMDMMNVKYTITQEGEPRLNSAANGTAWFVSNVIKVDSPEEELKALGNIHTNNTAIVLEREFKEETGEIIAGDGSGQIELIDYHPNRLTYSYQTNNQQLAVFPEVWFGPDKGWTATIDGEEVPIFRVNYILRALQVPPGSKTIVFNFHPNIGKPFEYAALVSSSLLLLLLIGLLGWEFIPSRST